MLTLTAGPAKLVLAPEHGGAIARLDLADKPILRPWNGDESAEPFAMASNILVPFSNRISGGGFHVNGQFFDIPENLQNERFPIHGDGFQKPWLQFGPHTLTLENGCIGPFKYRAVQRFALKPDSLHIVLHITNTGNITLPFGGGFHPWFPHNQDTRLSFSAQRVLLAGQSKIPHTHHHIAKNGKWDYSTPRALPASEIDTCWQGWHGPACGASHDPI